MNGAHVHLLLNHVPVLGSLFAFCILLYGIIIKTDSVIKVALILMVGVALVGIPAFLTGDEAKHVIDPVSTVNKNAMDVHEEIAEIAFWVLMISGAFALGTLIAMRSVKINSMPLVWLNLLILLLVVVLMARTAWSGGEIRHNEIHFKSVS